MRSSIAISSFLLLAACSSERPPATPAAATSEAAAPAPAPADQGDVIITETKADPDRMPDDAVHAGLRPRGDTTPRVLPGQAPRQGMSAPGPTEEGVELPLPLDGSGSVAELNKRKALVPEKFHALLDEAFRKLFTIQRDKRDGARARIIVDQLALESDPKLKATALRLLGFIAINSGFDEITAQARYEEALKLDPDYGEAHYTLAFTLGPRDPKTGREHFDRATALGVPDTRRLKEQFYRD